MLIVALLYACIVWLVFARFKFLPWNWPWRIATVTIGCVILVVFFALLNTLTPSGRIVVVGRVVEVTPNVAGTVTSISAEPNALFRHGGTARNSGHDPALGEGLRRLPVTEQWFTIAHRDRPRAIALRAMPSA